MEAAGHGGGLPLAGWVSQSLFEKGGGRAGRWLNWGCEPPNLSHGPDRPPVVLDQRVGACRKAGWSAPPVGYAAGRQRDAVRGRHRLPMADAAPRLSAVAKCLCLFP